eukprot:TRINITY_DN43467_c0_g1_i1.p1 TRINITY_DN43467_c0_g1~~TRINITY_DN43467_c0_g1_i1.p1  ORF type:complete len:767 (-),score=85.46 TRINITY_DN43467_c0_g1_i1:104-2404(-)
MSHSECFSTRDIQQDAMRSFLRRRRFVLSFSGVFLSSLAAVYASAPEEAGSCDRVGDAVNADRGCVTDQPVPSVSIACDGKGAGLFGFELRPGGVLCHGQWLVSPDKKFKAILHPHELVIYFSVSEHGVDTNHRVWTIWFSEKATALTLPLSSVHPSVLSGTGAHILDTSAWRDQGKILFRGNGDGGVRLVLTDGGELQVLDARGVRLWTSGNTVRVKQLKSELSKKVVIRAQLSETERCGQVISCAACRQASCGWCVNSRRCVPDEPRFCHGPKDHVGEAGDGNARCVAEQSPQINIMDSRSQTSSERHADGAEKARNGRDEDGSLASVGELRQRAANAQEESGSARPYEILGVRRDATPSEIRRAFRRLSLRLHPDKHTASLAELAQVAFADVVAAYDVIGNPDKRNEYDNFKGTAKEFENRWRQRGARGDEDFYFGHPLITTLTDRLWQSKIAGSGRNVVWLVELYGAWCGACRQFTTTFVNVAEALSHDDVEIAAVNCEKNPQVCSKHLLTQTIPSLFLLHPAHSFLKKFDEAPSSVRASVEEIVSWVRKVTSEWRFLHAMARVHMLGSEDWADDGIVLNSTAMWVVLFSDGLECAPCKTGKSNLMRLSASLRSLPVSCGVVDCAVHRSFCHKTHDVPPSPFRPLLKIWPRGPKVKGALGSQLLGSHELEPHVALRVMDTTLRAALTIEAPSDAVAGGTPAEFEGEEKSTQSEEGAFERSSESHVPPKPTMIWEGPSDFSGGPPNLPQHSQGRRPTRPQLVS